MEKRVDVLIAGPNSNSSCAVIADPPWGATRGEGFIPFNATGTYAVQCGSTCSGICLNNITYPRLFANSFNCTRFINEQTILNLTWSFDDGGVVSGSWDNFKMHYKLFGRGGPHWAVLKAIII